MDCPNCGYKMEDGMKSCLQCGFDTASKVFRPDRFAPLWKRLAALVVDAALSGLLIGLVLKLLHIGNGLVEVPLAYMIYVLYGTAFEVSPMQATPGKWLMGIRVISSKGKNMDLTFGFLRNFTKIFSFLTIIGAFLALFNDGRQTVHDLFGRDFVINRRDY